MSSADEPRHDARHCPGCGAMGILPLDQPRGADGTIVDPFMLCPVCEEGFVARGMTFNAVAVRPGLADAPDDVLPAWADEVVDRLLGRAS